MFRSTIKKKKSCFAVKRSKTLARDMGSTSERWSWLLGEAIMPPMLPIRLNVQCHLLVGMTNSRKNKPLGLTQDVETNICWKGGLHGCVLYTKFI